MTKSHHIWLHHNVSTIRCLSPQVQPKVLIHRSYWIHESPSSLQLSLILTLVKPHTPLWAVTSFIPRITRTIVYVKHPRVTQRETWAIHPQLAPFTGTYRKYITPKLILIKFDLLIESNCIFGSVTCPREIRKSHSGNNISGVQHYLHVGTCLSNQRTLASGKKEKCRLTG